MTVWVTMHDFARWDLSRQCWVNDHVAQYEYHADDWGMPTVLTGRSRIQPK